jgi:hypothetical protein
MVLDVRSVRIATGWRVRLFQDTADDSGPAASSTVARMFIEPFQVAMNEWEWEMLLFERRLNYYGRHGKSI